LVLVIHGPVPVPVGVWFSLATAISEPNPMPISLVAPKPVPVTVTVPPGNWAFGVSVIDPAADADEIVAMESIESIRKAVATVFLSSVFFTSPCSLEVSYCTGGFKILHARWLIGPHFQS